MQNPGGQTQSYWMATSQAPDYSALAQDLQADVCIIGAGIAGLSTAYLLTRAGRTVVVLDDGPVAGGESGRTTAHISNAVDDRYYLIERLHGQEGARLTAESHSAAIEWIEQLVQQESIDCDFMRLDGYLFLPEGERPEILDRELLAAQRAGLPVELVERAPAPFNTGRALRFPRQAQFHATRYLAGLAEAVVRRGGQIFCGSHAEHIQGGEHALVTVTGGRRVRARHIVVATNSPINDLVVMHTKQHAFRSYAIAARIRRDVMQPALLWDTSEKPRGFDSLSDMPESYHYVRLAGARSEDGFDHLIVGGEDHKVGQASNPGERWARLEAWTRERFPIEGVDARWSGQILEPVDRLAYIGPNPLDEANVFIATGDSGNGITHGTIAGLLLTDLITGRPNPWAKLYDPARKSLRTAMAYTKENLNVGLCYTDWVRPGDVESVDQIKPGEGAVLRRGLTMHAAYRDDAGRLHECSAVCTHLACIVHWNPGEKTWDCPCHGSRFDPYGKVINGPANTDLTPTPSAAAAREEALRK